MNDSLSKQRPPLYHTQIIHWSRNPHNLSKMEHPTCCAEGYNQSCGDHMHVYAKQSDVSEAFNEITFTADACAITKASASLMTDFLKGHSKESILKLIQVFKMFFLQPQSSKWPVEWQSLMEDLEVLFHYPNRIPCALLPWYTLESALKGQAMASSE